MVYIYLKVYREFQPPPALHADTHCIFYLTQTMYFFMYFLFLCLLLLFCLHTFYFVYVLSYVHIDFSFYHLYLHFPVLPWQLAMFDDHSPTVYLITEIKELFGLSLFWDKIINFVYVSIYLISEIKELFV